MAKNLHPTDIKHPFISWEEARSIDSEKDRILAVAPGLGAWYQNHARALPWRTDPPDPYGVMVSEIMLQQTRIEAVLPHYAQFMTLFPRIEALAAAPEERVLKAWEGLGYYSRARNLQKAAKVIVQRHNGRMPHIYTEILALPGIGPYTAGAIGSICYGLPVPAVDGNVLRVISRLTASRADVLESGTRKRVEGWLTEVLSDTRVQPALFNEGLMEIGETICLPKGEIRCGVCPLSPLCLARAEGVAEALPVRRKAKARRKEIYTQFLVKAEGEILLQKRPDKGLLAGLYQWPHTEGALNRAQAEQLFCLAGLREIIPLKVYRHVFTHKEWEMHTYRVLLTKKELPQEKPFKNCFYVSMQSLTDEYSLPTAFRQALLLEPLEGGTPENISG